MSVVSNMGERFIVVMNIFHTLQFILEKIDRIQTLCEESTPIFEGLPSLLKYQEKSVGIVSPLVDDTSIYEWRISVLLS